MKIKLSLLCVGLILIAGVFVSVPQKVDAQSNLTPAQTQELIQSLITQLNSLQALLNKLIAEQGRVVSWQTYVNPYLGFTVKYPNGTSISDKVSEGQKIEDRAYFTLPLPGQTFVKKSFSVEKLPIQAMVCQRIGYENKKYTTVNINESKFIKKRTGYNTKDQSLLEVKYCIDSGDSQYILSTVLEYPTSSPADQSDVSYRKFESDETFFEMLKSFSIL